MSRRIEPLKIYYNQDLMNRMNEMSVRLKVWLLDIENLKSRHSKPDNKELDDLFGEIYAELRKDSELMIKY